MDLAQTQITQKVNAFVTIFSHVHVNASNASYFNYLTVYIYNIIYNNVVET